LHDAHLLEPPALSRREVLAFVHATAPSPHKLAPRNVALVQLMLQAGRRYLSRAMLP
jgi:hypothetical protein